MTVVFGAFSFCGNDLSTQAVERIIQSASMNGQRKIQYTQTNNTLLGYVSFNDEKRILTDKAQQCEYLIGGEVLGNTSLVPVAGDEQDSRHISILTQLFSEERYKELADASGAFGLICYDKQRETCTIVNDPMGVYPIYTLQTEDCFFFASEYQTILSLNKNEHVLDRQFFAEWALYSFSCDGRTPLQSLQSLSPASIYRVSKDGNIQHSNYDIWDYTIDETLSLDEHVDIFKSTLQHVLVSFFTDNNVDYMPLTGGYDSRLMFAALPDDIRQSVNWVTNCSPYLQESEDRDVIIARSLAQKYNLNHEIITTFPEEEYIEEEGELYETLRPTKNRHGVHGHFSGYLRGKYVDFEQCDRNRDNLFASLFSKEMCSWAQEEFHPISSRADFHKDENRALKYYLLNNIRCFLNHDNLGGRKWVNPICFFWYPLRAPYGAPSLCRQLLRVPQAFIKGGLLFLKLMEAFDEELFHIPFTAAPFPSATVEQLKCAPQKITEGTDYTAVRRPFWRKQFTQYLYSARPLKRHLYSNSYLLKLLVRHWSSSELGESLLPRAIVQHWRFKRWLPPSIDQNFVRVEDWLRYYADTENKVAHL